MNLGYARVSTKDPDVTFQLDALKKAECDQIYYEKITGTIKERPQLNKLLEHLRPGDVVVVWKLDRLARSFKDLIELVNKIQQRGADLHSLTDQINTNTPQGKLTFHLFAALSEFERDIIKERTIAGLAAARAKGRSGGRPKGLSQKKQHTAIIAEKLYQEKKLTVTQICAQLSISRPTFYAYLRHRGVKLGKQS